MRFLRKIFLISAVLILFSGLLYTFFLAFGGGPIDYEINEQRAYFYLGKQTKEKDLKHLKAIFKEKGNIDIDYSGSTFGRNGQLLRLQLTVNNNRGSMGGTSHSPFRPVVYEVDFLNGTSSIGQPQGLSSFRYWVKW